MDALLPVAVLVLVALSRAIRRAVSLRPAPPAGPRRDVPDAPAPVPSPAPAPAPAPIRLPEPAADRPRASTLSAPIARRRPVRRVARRLDVGRDLIAAELLAPPVSLRQGGAPWR